MTDFRYDQHCPLARAAEVLAERWTVLIVRDLLLGPQRFSDLRERLAGVSTSVLSSRLRALEERGVITRRQLPPPAASTVIELTELGRGLRPVVLAMASWGIQLLGPRRPTDHYEPSWLRIGLTLLMNPNPTREHCFELRMPDRGGDVVIHVAGGPGGTRIYEGGGDAPSRDRIDATLRGEAELLLGVVTGGVDPFAEQAAGRLEISGDIEAVRDFQSLFSVEAAQGGHPAVNVLNSPTQENPPN